MQETRAIFHQRAVIGHNRVLLFIYNTGERLNGVSKRSFVLFERIHVLLSKPLLELEFLIIALSVE
jgi:hypothetical protein